MPAVASYPRPNGILVPTCLAQAGCARPEGEGAPGAAQVVAWLRRSRRRLPAALLALELPEPRVLLSSWVIGQRTRGSLERLLDTQGGPVPRCLGDYLEAPWMGLHAIVDLLAAREEREAAAAPAAEAPRPPEPLRLVAVAGPESDVERLSAVIRDALPATPADVLKVIRAAGLAAREAKLDDLVRLYREHDTQAPFRVVRRAGATVLVAPEHLAAAEALLRGAAHYVFNWGLGTLNAVVSRLRALAARPLEPAAAARILAAIPRFRWLDPDAGWFSFASSGSRLRAALRKIFSLTDRVLLGDLRAALAKQIELLATVPGEAIETYLAEIAGCEIAEGWVSARAARKLDAAVPLGKGEEALVDLLRTHGGEISTRALRALAKRQGLAAPALLRLVRTSPLLLERGGRLRLVGEPRTAFSPRPRLAPAARAAA